MAHEIDFAKIADWAFREGWNERSRMVGVNKKALDNQFYSRIRIMLANKHYLKALDNPYLGTIAELNKQKLIYDSE
jgi:hypothetical protein